MRKKALKILFLIGTKQSIDEMQRIKEGLPYRGMLAVLSIRRSGGLALLWMEEVNLHIQTFTQNHIDALILNEPNTPWRLTSFYGWPEEQRKNESWHLLWDLHSRHLVPWLCLGDFNEILKSEEKQGGLQEPLNLMQAFRETLLHCGLVDLGFRGNMFTWNNGRPGGAFVQERLDKVCAIIEWRELFPCYRVTNIQASYLDHVPILVTTHNTMQPQRRKKIPCRYEEKWASHPSCEAIIQEAWSTEVRRGSPMAVLFERIKEMQVCLSGVEPWSFWKLKNIIKEETT